MPTLSPGVYIEEIPSSARTITGVPTSITAFVGAAKEGPLNSATAIHSYADYQQLFGGLHKESNMSYSIYQYFQNGGTDALVVRVAKTVPPKPTLGRTPKPSSPRIRLDRDLISSRNLLLQQNSSATELSSLDDKTVLGDPVAKTGIYALKDVDIFNLLCIPAYNEPDTRRNIFSEALAFCNQRRAILLIDPPAGSGSWNSADAASSGIDSYVNRDKNGVVYFPHILAPDPLDKGKLRQFDPSGAVAGVIARTDAQRGVWKAPAGIETTLTGVSDLAVKLTDSENGDLNLRGINCLRNMPGAGLVVWGSRTLRGVDSLGAEWKYLPVRRTALFVEESLYRGTQWVVFEVNDGRLWSRVRLTVGAFMHSLFVKGAFQGSDPKGAYFVKCDGETNTQLDVEEGVVNIIVGFAALRPGEFIVIRIQQKTAHQK